jgi:hypothetical protein
MKSTQNFAKVFTVFAMILFAVSAVSALSFSPNPVQLSESSTKEITLTSAEGSQTITLPSSLSFSVSASSSSPNVRSHQHRTAGATDAGSSDQAWSMTRVAIRWNRMLN